MFQMKEQTPKEEPSKVEMSCLHNKEFKVMLMKIKILNELRKRMDEHSDKFNKVLENTKKNQTELKNIITEAKNILEGLTTDWKIQRNRSANWKIE